MLGQRLSEIRAVELQLHVEPGFQPRRQMLPEPVEVARQALDEQRHLLLEQRDHDQQQCSEQAEQKHHGQDGAQGAGDFQAVQPVYQRVADVGEDGREQEWREDGAEQIKQPAHRGDRQQPPQVVEIEFFKAFRVHLS